MTMMDMFKLGYKVTVGNDYGDVVMETAEDVETALEDGAELVEADHNEKTAYYYIDIYADEEEWGEDL